MGKSWGALHTKNQLKNSANQHVRANPGVSVLELGYEWKKVAIVSKKVGWKEKLSSRLFQAVPVHHLDILEPAVT